MPVVGFSVLVVLTVAKSGVVIARVVGLAESDDVLVVDFSVVVVLTRLVDVPVVSVVVVLEVVLVVVVREVVLVVVGHAPTPG